MTALPQLVARHAVSKPRTVAMRAKKSGIWRQTSWEQLDNELRVIAHGLAALGIATDDRVAILAGNRPEWLYAELSATALRAALVGIHPATPYTAVEQILTDAGARVLFAEDQEQVDKALATGCPRLRWIVYLESIGLEEYSDPRLLSYAQLRDRGRTHAAEHCELLPSFDASRTDDDVVTLVYVVNSETVRPTPTELRSRDIAAVLDSVRDALPGPAPDERDVLLPGLSLCDPAERALTVWTCAATGAVIHFAESYDTLRGDLIEVQPTLRLIPTAAWQQMFADIEQRMAAATRIKRIAYRLASVAARTAAERMTNGRHTMMSHVLGAIAYLLCGRALREKLGLRETRTALRAITVPGTELSVVAPDPGVVQYFLGFGVPIDVAGTITDDPENPRNGNTRRRESDARPVSNMDATP